MIYCNHLIIYVCLDIINRFTSLKTDGTGVIRSSEVIPSSEVIRSPEVKPSVTPSLTVKCQSCQEYYEPRHMFYCAWCSNCATEPVSSAIEYIFDLLIF